MLTCSYEVEMRFPSLSFFELARARVNQTKDSNMRKSESDVLIGARSSLMYDLSKYARFDYIPMYIDNVVPMIMRRRRREYSYKID